MTRFWRWVAACILAESIGICVAAVAALAVPLALGGAADTAAGRVVLILAMTVAGAIEGAALGLLQWRVLRERLRHLRRGAWVGITAVVASLGWLVGMWGPVFGDAPADPAPSLGVVIGLAAAVGTGAGAVIGAAQWLVLRRHARHAGRWIPIQALGWAGALAMIFLGASIPDESWPMWWVVQSAAAGGLLGGLVLGLITASTAIDLRPGPRSATQLAPTVMASSIAR